ncbi:MAG: hypothetical protein K0U98_13005 [Deltaproteobacteria bacterium]|nr:hypothetical protein [Deltaproteobacteria bacterium]
MESKAARNQEIVGSETNPAEQVDQAGLAVSLLKLAQTLRRGSVQATSLMTSEEVSGFRIIRDPTATDFRELKLELAALRGRLDEAMIAGIGDSATIYEAQLGLTEVAAELIRPEPSIDLLTDGFGWAADRIQETSAEACERGELTFSLSQLAVSSAALWDVAQRVLPANQE